MSTSKTNKYIDCFLFISNKKGRPEKPICLNNYYNFNQTPYLLVDTLTPTPIVEVTVQDLR